MSKRVLTPFSSVPEVKRHTFQNEEECVSFKKRDFMHNLSTDTSRRFKENRVAVEEWSGNTIYFIII